MRTAFSELFPTGFNYASFLTGRVDNEVSSAVNDTRLGNHSFGVFIQDNWKITHKLTLDYGLRWDYATLLSEQYGRMQNANFFTVNPQVGLPGSIEYGATCHCQFNHTYPFSIGPRLGLAYQISPRTVFRAGAGVSYSSSADNAFLSYSVANFYTLTGNGYGNPVTTPLAGGQSLRFKCGDLKLSDIQPVPVSDLPACEQLVAAFRRLRRSSRSIRARAGCPASSNGASGSNARLSRTCWSTLPM